MKPHDVLKEKSSLWIFGYGSLVWKPGFAYKGRKVGHIKGYKRRFWHGDDFYRGDKENVRFTPTRLPSTNNVFVLEVFVVLCWRIKAAPLFAARQGGHTSGGPGGEHALILKVP